MLHETKCLTYPDLVACLDSASAPCAPGRLGEHIDSCAKCGAVLKTMQELIRNDATPEEAVVLDKLENRPFQKVNLRVTAHEVVFVFWRK